MNKGNKEKVKLKADLIEKETWNKGNKRKRTDESHYFNNHDFVNMGKSKKYNFDHIECTQFDKTYGKYLSRDNFNEEESEENRVIIEEFVEYIGNAHLNFIIQIFSNDISKLFLLSLLFVAGVEGTNGVDSAIGVEGTNGIEGTNGVEGTTGVDGVTGVEGNIVATGVKDAIEMRRRRKKKRIRGKN